MSDVDAGARPDPPDDAAAGDAVAPAGESAPEGAGSEGAGPAAPAAAAVESASVDVDRDAGSSALPGEHRGGFKRALTEPVPTAETVQPEPDVRWAPTPAPMPRSGPWALGLAIVGLAVSFVVGWGVVIGLVAIVLAIIALRRPWESRGVAIWALCLAVLSLIYSAGWLWWAWTRIPIVG